MSFVASANTSNIINLRMLASSTAHNKPMRNKRSEKPDNRNRICLFVRFWNAKYCILDKHWLKDLLHQYTTDIKEIIVYEEGKYTSYGKIEFKSYSVAKIVVQELQGHKLFQVRYWRISDAPTNKISPAVLKKSSSKDEFILRKCESSGSDTREAKCHQCLFVRFWDTKGYILNIHWLKELLHKHTTDTKEIIVYEEGSYGKIEFESHSVANIVLQKLLCHKVLEVRFWRISDAPTDEISPTVLKTSSSKDELNPGMNKSLGSDTGEAKCSQSKSTIKCEPLSEAVQADIRPCKGRLMEGVSPSTEHVGAKCIPRRSELATDKFVEKPIPCMNTKVTETIKFKDESVGYLMVKPAHFQKQKSLTGIKLTMQKSYLGNGYCIEGRPQAVKEMLENVSQYYKCLMENEKVVNYSQTLFSSVYSPVCSVEKIAELKENLIKMYMISSSFSLVSSKQPDDTTISQAFLRVSQDHVVTVKIVVGSLSAQKTDAIVIPTGTTVTKNTYPIEFPNLHTQSFQDDTCGTLCNSQKLFKLCDVGIMDGGKLPCSYIIHIIYPKKILDFSNYCKSDFISNCLSIASEKRIGSVSFPKKLNQQVTWLYAYL